MKARKLKDDITIGVFSSSSPISATVPVRYERGVKYLESKGYKIINGQLYRKKDNYRSGTIQERAQEFNQLLYNEDVQILMASIGGNNTNSILPYIDYEYLKKHPKIIIGYSDVTALLLAIYAKTGLITFYGPAVASSFGELPPFVDWTFDSFNSMIKGTISFPYCYEKPEVWTEEFINWAEQTSVYKGYKQDKIEMRGDRAEMSDFPLYLNTVAGGLDRRDQTIGGFSFVVKIYAVPVVEIIG